MARITSQKAIQAIGGDQFLLIRMASYRARLLASGKDNARVEVGENKWGVVAIREIEEEKYTVEEYEQNLLGIGFEEKDKEDDDEYKS